MSTEKTIEELEAEFNAEMRKARLEHLLAIKQSFFATPDGEPKGGEMSTAQAIGAIYALLETAGVLAGHIDADEDILRHMLSDALETVQRSVFSTEKLWSTNPDSLGSLD